MAKKIIIFFCGLLFCFSAFSQEEGYRIKFNFSGIDQQKLYLKANYGDKYFIFDSAQADKNGFFTFKNKSKQLPKGIYQLVNRENESYFDIIVGSSQHFTLTGDLNTLWKNCRIEGSDENAAFYILQRQVNANRSPQQLIEDLQETMPQSLLCKYATAQFVKIPPPDFRMPDSTHDVQKEYLYYTEHFFDNITFTDERLLRTPVEFDIDIFFTEIVIQQEDSMIREIKAFLEKSKTNQEMQNYCLKTIYHILDQNNSHYDKAMVWLYDTYCQDSNCEWLEDHYQLRLKRQVNEKRKTLVGATVPPLGAFDENREAKSSEEVKNNYILLWFWDPDCEDCLLHTPELYDFYETFYDLYDFEVFAISISQDFEKWKTVSAQFPAWINVSYAAGEPNYDFVDYFNILTTPGIYLIDKNHTIIARQFPLRDILEVFNH
ncbi:MAG: DUF5106 domain-containing protein [Bacteroidales bacterium]|jgi:hypothetical protein|nr:DUF5106 domain-containing protein [Bacteroidales bacterium]